MQQSKEPKKEDTNEEKNLKLFFLSETKKLSNSNIGPTVLASPIVCKNLLLLASGLLKMSASCSLRVYI